KAGVVKESKIRLLRGHLQQAFQIRETYPSAGVLVELLFNTGAVKFSSELNVVLVELPGEAVDELIVGIHTLPGIAGGGADLGKESCGSGCVWHEKDDGNALRVTS